MGVTPQRTVDIWIDGLKDWFVCGALSLGDFEAGVRLALTGVYPFKEGLIHELPPGPDRMVMR